MNETQQLSLFEEKIAAACQKKEALFDESLGRYALRSMLAGAYLTMSTAVGIACADAIAADFPALSRFLFAFVFSFGLVYVLFFNGELATSNMMYLSAGAYYRKISLQKAITILVFCTLFNLIGASILAWLFNQSYSFGTIDQHSYMVNTVQKKLAKTDWQNLIEGITANMFVNLAILAYMLLKDQGAKITIVVSAIFMFVFLSNEHLVANFASFMLAAFSNISHIKGLDIFNVLRQWFVVFFGNWIGGGICIGLAYAWLNQTKTKHRDS